MAATVNLSAFPFSQQLDCPKCHHKVTLYDPSGSEYVVCANCNSYCRLLPTGNLQVQQPVGRLNYEPILPLGKQCVLRETPYKVIAYMEKMEAGTSYEWREYMLYSFTKGYAFLAEYNGHWSFIAGITHYPQLADASILDSMANMDGIDYLEYNRYTPLINALIGEFDWDAYEERVLTREFINPPFMLVREKDKHNERIINWYLGEHMEPEEIAEGFSMDVVQLPLLVDIGANQPNPYKKRWQQILKISITAALLMLVIQLIFSILRPTQSLLSKTVPINIPLPAHPDSARRDTGITAVNYNDQNISNGNYEYQPLRTSAFEIFNGPAPVRIALSAPVDNNWFEATVELVNEKDNQTWDAAKEIDYYHGYEDGESWSEGSTSESVLIPDVPKGKYHLNIYPYAGTPLITDMTVMVTANVMLWQNLIITFLLLCVVPLCYWLVQRQYEVKRWMNSDFSPYKKQKAMIKNLAGDLKSNILYLLFVLALLTWFAFDSYNGSEFIPDNGVQKNAGYSGPIPHSGYGVRFYHK